MAKKRKKKGGGGAAKVWAVLLIAIPVFLVLVLSSIVAGLVIYHIGVCPGVAAGGGTALLCGLLWLASKTYGEFPEGTPNSPLVMLGLIFVNGLENIEQCVPQMITIVGGLIIVIAGIGGWILIANVNPELNRDINPSLMKKK